MYLNLRFLGQILWILAVSQVMAIEHAVHWVDFSRADGKYLKSHLEEDFGNGGLDTSKKVFITDSVAQVRFLAGKKISATAMQSRVSIPIRQQYSLKYRIRYHETFEKGMHGKQFGFYGGKGTYDGGAGENCRTNGDGWNVKLQFDAHETTVSNQLYVYYSQMSGDYGNSLGTGSIKYHFPKGKWVEIGLTITMQTHADSANGRIEVWSDGVKKFDVKAIRFVTKETGRTIRSVSLDHFNGGGGITPTIDSHTEFDDMRWWDGPMSADPWATFAQNLRVQADSLETKWRNTYLIPSGKLNDIKKLHDSAVAYRNAFSMTTQRWTNSNTYKLNYPIGDTALGRNDWATHLQRTRDMFKAWRQQGSAVYGDKAFAKACSTAMEGYLKSVVPPRKDPYRGTYWHPYADLIENPQIGEILLYARNDRTAFPQVVIERWSRRVTQGQERIWTLNYSDAPDPRINNLMAEANLYWTTRGLVSLALVQGDSANRIHRLDTLFRNLWFMTGVRWHLRNPIEGFTADGLVGAHYIPYNGGAYAFMGNAIDFRTWTSGISRWQSPKNLDSMLVNVILDGLVPTAQVHYDIQTAGKDYLPAPNSWNNTQWLPNDFLDAGHREQELNAVSKWQQGKTDFPFPNKSVRLFHTADYITKHYPKHLISYRAVSRRTNGTETFGYDATMPRQHIFFPLGTSFIYRDATEYRFKKNVGGIDADSSVWPVFDYSRTPGMTTLQIDSNTIKSAWNYNPTNNSYSRMVFGNTDFAGGVESASRGVFGYQQSDTILVDYQQGNLSSGKRSRISVSGRKAVFFLDNAVVHLGTGFDISGHSQRTRTSLDQRRSESTTWYNDGTTKQLTKGSTVRKPKIAWVWHDSVGYLFPQTDTAVIEDITKTRSGFTNGTRQIFSAYVEHGNSNKNLSFDWAVVLGTSPAQLESISRNRPWTIVSNTKYVQAIHVPSAKWTGVVFHRADSLKVGTNTISVDRPAILAVQESGNEWRIHVGDPLNTNGKISIRIGNYSKTLNLPTGNMSGSTIATSIMISASSSSSKPVSSSSKPVSSSSTPALSSSSSDTPVSNLRISPNPIVQQGDAYFTWKPTARPSVLYFTVVDAKGNVVRRWNDQNIYTGTNRVWIKDIHQLAKGSYFLEIKDNRSILGRTPFSKR